MTVLPDRAGEIDKGQIPVSALFWHHFALTTERYFHDGRDLQGYCAIATDAVRKWLVEHDQVCDYDKIIVGWKRQKLESFFLRPFSLSYLFYVIIVIPRGLGIMFIR